MVMSVVMSSGIMIAVPDAWMTRATRRISKPGAMKATAVPVEKRVIAARNTCRVVKRWRRKPLIGITTAIVSMNAVVSHWAATAVMPRSTMRWGIATPIVVSLRIATKAADRRSQMIRLSSGRRFSPGTGVAESGPAGTTGIEPVCGFALIAATGGSSLSGRMSSESKGRGRREWAHESHAWWRRSR